VFRPILFIFAALLCSAGLVLPLRAQQGPGFPAPGPGVAPAAPRMGPSRESFVPGFAHHEGPTLAATGTTVAGAVLGSMLVNGARSEPGWERGGALAFTMPFAAAGTFVGLLAQAEAEGFAGSPTISVGAIVGGIAGGVIGGALGRRAGRRAAAGSSGAKTGVVGMGILSVPATLVIYGLNYLVGYDS
jgi:hypothetical protein